MKQTVSPSKMTQFNVKAVLIDLDGTMLNTAPEIAWSANAMLEALQLPSLPTAKVQSYIGEGALTLIKRCITEAQGVAPHAELLEEARIEFFEQYAEICSQSKPYPNVENALKSLQKLGLPNACVTNKPALFTHPILDASGLKPYFDSIICGDTLEKKKPEPDQIFHVCQQFGIDPWHALLIGDSNTDILAAKNAGCYVFTVPYGYNQGLEIDQTSVDAMIQDLTEAILYIQT